MLQRPRPYACCVGRACHRYRQHVVAIEGYVNRVFVSYRSLRVFPLKPQQIGTFVRLQLAPF